MESSPKKNILCISVMETWGGGEEYLINLCNNIKGFNFIIASPGGESLNGFIANGVKTVKINSLKKFYRIDAKWRPGDFLSIALNLLFSTISLIGIVSREKIKLVIANGNFAGLYALPLRFFSKVRIISIQHLIYENPTYEKKIINWLCKYSSGIVCVSNAVKSSIINFLPQDSDNKIFTIHNGINLPPAQQVTEAQETKLIRIGMVGSIIRIKGIDLVLEVIDLLKDKFRFQLHIYGDNVNTEDSINYKNELKRFVKINKLDDIVFFHGRIESKVDIYKNLEIVINFSIIFEAFPFAILEAMSFKKLVVATNSGGPAEIITDGENGFLVKPNDKHKLENRLTYILNNFNTSEIMKIRNNAYSLVRDRFGIKNFAEKYESLFNSVFDDENL
jgi:glycosyltransferase involved in cell wall biosynthesis